MITWISKLINEYLPMIEGTNDRYVSASNKVSSVKYRAKDVVLSLDPAIYRKYCNLKII